MQNKISILQKLILLGSIMLNVVSSIIIYMNSEIIIYCFITVN